MKFAPPCPISGYASGCLVSCYFLSRMDGLPGGSQLQQAGLKASPNCHRINVFGFTSLPIVCTMKPTKRQNVIMDIMHRFAVSQMKHPRLGYLWPPLLSQDKHCFTSSPLIVYEKYLDITK